MGYYIGTKTECEAYNAKATKAEGITGDKTKQWSEVIKHPAKDLFAVTIHESITAKMTKVEQLPADWYLIDEL